MADVITLRGVLLVCGAAAAIALADYYLIIRGGRGPARCIDRLPKPDETGSGFGSPRAKCEICGRRATIATCDVRQDGHAGGWWRRRRSTLRYWCAGHRPVQIDARTRDGKGGFLWTWPGDKHPWA